MSTRTAHTAGWYYEDGKRGRGRYFVNEEVKLGEVVGVSCYMGECRSELGC